MKPLKVLLILACCSTLTYASSDDPCAEHEAASYDASNTSSLSCDEDIGSMIKEAKATLRDCRKNKCERDVCKRIKNSIRDLKKHGKGCNL